MLVASSILSFAACSSNDGGDAAATLPSLSTAETGATTATSAAIGESSATTSGTAATDPSDVTTTTVGPTDQTSTSVGDDTTTTAAGDATTTTLDPAATPTSQPVDPETSPTSIVPTPGVYDGACVVEVAAGESLSLIADRYDDETVTVPALRLENGIAGDQIDPGDLLDICVGNSIDDVTGEQRTEADSTQLATIAAVEQQQNRLNELFLGLGTPPLLVDGISGPVTRQRLCAARLALGLPVNTLDMVAGSEEEQILLAAPTLPVPFTSVIQDQRWILIDRTCQVMFVGEGPSKLTFMFPTSTGSEGFETRDQDRSRVFRYNPALDNGGWHNSTSYPVADDNPLNGNMYKPLYFDRGQAIHGANNVPTTPQSKGCARLRVEHQEMLIAWLGIGDIARETQDTNRLNLRVNVQGIFVPS